MNEPAIYIKLPKVPYRGAEKPRDMADRSPRRRAYPRPRATAPSARPYGRARALCALVSSTLIQYAYKYIYIGLLPPIQPPTLSILTAVGRRTVAPDSPPSSAETLCAIIDYDGNTHLAPRPSHSHCCSCCGYRCKHCRSRLVTVAHYRSLLPGTPHHIAL